MQDTVLADVRIPRIERVCRLTDSRPAPGVMGQVTVREQFGQA